MRILFVTPYVPSSVRGRPFSLIRELAKLGHEVTLACLIQPVSEEKYLEEVRPYCKAVYPVKVQKSEAYRNALLSLPTRVPLSVAYCKSAALDQQVNALIATNNYDLLHSEFVRTAPVTMNIQSLPKVFDCVDSLTLAYRRSINAAAVSPIKRAVAVFEWLKMRSYETYVIKHYDRALVSSPEDRRTMQADDTNIEVLPNGVDLKYFAYDDRPRDPATIVFLGKMSYYVNVASVLWFYKEIFPIIQKAVPAVKFKIVGREPVQAILDLAKDASVEVTGSVEDVRPHLASATVAVCPMVTGSGIQNKMLEAMAVGTPCVATSLASQALQIQHGVDASIHDSAQDFADAVLALLKSPREQRAMAEHARQYVETHHDWAKIGQRLEQVYHSLNRQPDRLVEYQSQQLPV